MFSGYKAQTIAQSVEGMSNHILNASSKTRKVAKQSKLLQAVMSLTEKVGNFLEGNAH